MFRAARLENAGGSAGFTIIEVLIALAVIAVCLAAIGTVVGVTSRGVRSLEQRVALVEVARAWLQACRRTATARSCRLQAKFWVTVGRSM